MVQNFQRESIFCSKIRFGGSLFIKKLLPGGNQFLGSIFTMTDPTPTRLALVRLVAVLQQKAGNNSHQRFKILTFKS